MTRSFQRMVAVGAATVTTLVAWVWIHFGIGTDLTVRSGAMVMRVGAGAVAATTIVAGLAGWAVLALLERFTQRPRRWWIGIAIGFFVISLAGPAGGTTAAVVGSLIALHSVAAVTLIAGMSATARARKPMAAS